jgi:hypothetical protein
MVMMMTGVMSARVMSGTVMRAVAMMLMGSERRCGKHHQEERGSEYFLHGTNLPRCRSQR